MASALPRAQRHGWRPIPSPCAACLRALPHLTPAYDLPRLPPPSASELRHPRPRDSSSLTELLRCSLAGLLPVQDPVLPASSSSTACPSCPDDFRRCGASCPMVWLLQADPPRFLPKGWNFVRCSGSCCYERCQKT